ncbi:MAG: putrescine aminotransferase [Firmicutes bacterium]|nr:putrescine aminotransferase [Bacillota bacterium]
MNFNPETVISYSSKVLNFISKKELSDQDKDWVTSETLEGFKENCNPGFLEYRKAVSNNYAAVEWEDSGTGFTDLQGRKYIDCLGGYGVYNLGHRHPLVVEAVRNQLERQALHSQELLDPLRAMLSRLVAMIAPGNLKYSFLTNSGTESVEGAIKLARLHTGRPGIIAAVGGYHGKSLGSLSATGKEAYRLPFLPLMPFFQHVPYGDAEMLRKTIASSHAVGHQVAAVILEPIQGEGGVVVPPDDYLMQVRDICDSFGTLLIIDEVQTGMGRTGMLFAVEHFGVTPDIMCLGKAFGGGVMPIGAFVSTEAIWKKMIPNPFLHSTTFGGNPLACAAAIAGIKVIFDEGLIEQAAEKGNYILPKLQRIARKYPALREARGKGLLIGLEFVDDHTGYRIAKGLFENGILVAGALNNAAAIRIEPPLTIAIEEIDHVIEVLEKVIKRISEHYND